jgi:hypothetical protein
MSKIGDIPSRPAQSNEPQGQPLGGAAYVLVSLAMLAVAALTAYYMLIHPGDAENESSDLAYYGVALILGLAAASFLFGAMRSYARYSGKTSLGSLELGGPVVVAALVIAGFFYERHLQEPFSVRVQVQNKDAYLSDLFPESKLETSFDDKKSISINRDGDAFIWNIPAIFKGKKIRITTIVPGFSQVDPDPNKEEVPLTPRKTIKVTLKPNQTNVMLKLYSQDEPNVVKEISDALQANNIKLNNTQEKTLEYFLIRAIRLVHPDWTDWEEGEPEGLKSIITMVPIQDPPKYCRGAKWEVRKSESSVTLFAKACHNGDLNWEIEVEPINKPQSGRPDDEKSLSGSSAEEVVLEFVNRTKHEANVFRRDDNGRPVRYASMSHEGSKSFVQTYGGRSWIAKNRDGKDLVLRTKNERNSSYVAKNNKRYAKIEIVDE